MEVVISIPDSDTIFTIQVQMDDNVEDIKALIEVETQMPSAEISLSYQGRDIEIGTVAELKFVQHDALLVTKKRRHMQLSDIPNNPSPEVLLQLMEENPHLLLQLENGNPKLAAALKSKDVVVVRGALMMQHFEMANKKIAEAKEAALLERDPMNPEHQAKIEENIRLGNVQQNMEMAMEEMPESFGRVYMLYVPCQVNNVPVKAFVDSGAQSTIMSSNCAKRCNIMRLVDTRFAGQAVGVGTAKIIGRVHMASLKIGNNVFFNCSFTILDQQDVDFLFGLDMLKRHQCCIDLHQNKLLLKNHDTIEAVDFLPEHEIPVNTPGQNLKPESSNLQHLQSMGFTPQQAQQALTATNNDLDQAIQLLSAD